MESKSMVKKVVRMVIEEDFLPTCTKEESEICQKCPYDDCIYHWYNGCDFLRTKMEELRNSKK